MQRNHSGVLLLQMQMLNPIGSMLAMPAVPTEGLFFAPHRGNAPEDFQCLIKNRLPVSFKNPLSNRITDLVPDNFIISTANKKLVLQEKQAKLLSDTASNQPKIFACFISDQEQLKIAGFVCHWSRGFLKL